jgi:hypothetical protein
LPHWPKSVKPHPGHKEKENQNNIEILSHPSQSGYHQENKQQMLRREWGKGKLYPLLVGM